MLMSHVMVALSWILLDDLDFHSTKRAAAIGWILVTSSWSIIQKYPDPGYKRTVVARAP